MGNSNNFTKPVFSLKLGLFLISLVASCDAVDAADSVAQSTAPPNFRPHISQPAVNSDAGERMTDAEFASQLLLLGKSVTDDYSGAETSMVLSGIRVANLTSPSRSKFGISRETNGVLIAEILTSFYLQPGSDIKVGDLITEVSHSGVSDIADLKAKLTDLESLRQTSVLLRLRKGDGSTQVIRMDLK